MNRPRIALLVSAVAFAAYPALRPYGPESGAEGSSDLASTAWLASHVLGMVGFVGLALASRSAGLRVAEGRAWVAVALLLPYYGAEAYGLNELGRYAVEHRDPGVLDVADAFRYAPFEVATFGLGLLVLAAAGVALARATWHRAGAARAGGVLTAVGLVTYLPQYFGTPEVRIAHGVVLGLGLLIAALTASDRPVHPSVRPGAPSGARPGPAGPQAGRSSASTIR